MAGRKPKPTHLKAVAGTLQKCRTNENEPKPKSNSIKMPRDLCPKAKKEWRAIVKQLTDAGVMSNLDVFALRLYCDAYVRYSDAWALVQKTGMITKTPNGMLIQNPALPIMNKAYEQMMKILVEFGATPSARQKVATLPELNPDDPWDIF